MGCSGKWTEVHAAAVPPFFVAVHGLTLVPGLKPWVIIGRDRSALRAVLESGLKSTRRLCRLYDGGSGQARSACLCKRTEVRKATWSPFLLLYMGLRSSQG